MGLKRKRKRNKRGGVRGEDISFAKDKGDTREITFTRKIHQTWKIFSFKLEILQKLEDLERTERKTANIWEDIQAKSNEVNKVYLKQERENFSTKKIAVASILGDILQGTILLVLILRTELRLRGSLGLADLASHDV